MRPRTRSVVLVLALVSQSLVAALASAAGPYTDELSKCLVRSTTAADKTLLVQWMFATLALHPDVGRFAEISDAQRKELNEKLGRLFERLLTDACVTEARDALKYEGSSALETSFNVLGQVAARELLANPSVAEGVAEMQRYLDSELVKKKLGLEK